MKFLALILGISSLTAYAVDAGNKVVPEGREESTKTRVLEAGAKVMQEADPSDQLDIYLVGFHPMKDHPHDQMEAHHFCKQVNEDFAQCALFDGNTKNANLNGIEYIISEKLFDSLPQEEKKYWHPHNYEILSGQLIAPGLPAFAEKQLMKSKINSYGKTWHVWNTGHYGKNDGTKLPFGKPMLAWSFNCDGEVQPGLVKDMEKRLNIDLNKKREARQELVPLAKPQMGVNSLSKEFKGTKSIPGVKESRP